MRKIFFVFGPEGNGTRMLTEALIRCGCVGNYEHIQHKLEDGMTGLLRLPDKDGLYVFRNSVPHRREYNDLGKMVRGAIEGGWEVKVFVIVRSLVTCIQRDGFNTFKSGKWEEGLKHIFSSLSDVEFTIVSYEAFVCDARYRKKLLGGLANYPPDMEFRDENAKYVSRVNKV